MWQTAMACETAGSGTTDLKLRRQCSIEGSTYRSNRTARSGRNSLASRPAIQLSTA